MAGLNLTIHTSTKEVSKTKFHIKSLPHLTTKTIWDNNDYYLNLFAYDNYPYQEYLFEDYKVFVEGKVYNKSGDSLISEIDNLVKLLRKNTVAKEKITEILFRLDGDFIIVVKDKLHNKLHVLNDLYSRLPMYIANNKDRLVISRNQQFIIENLNLKDIDRYAVAEFLLFNCTVTNRTLVDGIRYFEPATLFTYDCTSKTHSFESIFTFNFEDNIRSFNKSEYRVLIKQIKEDFEKATHDRSKNNDVILGLSGGIDSRVIAAVFPKLESNNLCISRLNKNNREKRDVELAKQVSTRLKLKHDIVKLDNSFDHLKEELLYLKSGLNDLDNLHNLNFEKKLYELYGNNFSYYTGCGGEVFKPFVKIRRAKNTEELIKNMINDKINMSLADIANLTKTDSQKLLYNLINEVESFPESSPKYKHLHFLMYKNLFRYDFEGEDRKRNFFWSVTPFLSHDFFIKALSVPNNYRNLHRFTIDIMNALDERITDIPNRNWELKPNDWRVPMHLWIRDQVSTKTKVRVAGLIKRLKGRQSKSLNINIEKELINSDLFAAKNQITKIDLKSPLIDTILSLDRLLDKRVSK